MGANEYTPDTEQVREQYTREQPPHIGTVSQKRSELDRWLEHIKREAKAEALEEMANVLESDIPSTSHENGQIIAGRHIIRIIRARADQYRERK